MQDKKLGEFLIIWSGQLISAIGSGLTAFSLGVYTFQNTHSAISYSLVILFAFLPSFVLLPFGGVLADRFDRKKMMIIGDAGAIAGVLFILLIMLRGSFQLEYIYGGVAISSVFTAIQSPAYKAAVSDLVPEELYSQASGLIQLAGSAQYLISPIIAGLLISVFHMGMVLVIDIITFLMAITAVLMIKKPDTAYRKQEKEDFFQDMAESFRYIISQKGIFYLVLLTSLVCFCIGLLQALFGPMILTLTNSKMLGIALSIAASGMLVSSLFIGVLGLKKSMVSILSIFLALSGLFYALMGVFSNIIFIIVFGFLFFSTLPFVNTSLEVLIRRNADNERQGRLWSMVAIISQVGYIMAFGSAGFLADHLFNPLFNPNGALSHSIGLLIGTGQGRGIGFIFILSGLCVVILALVIGRAKKIKVLDLEIWNGGSI